MNSITTRDIPPGAIAIVGMSCRFPGAPDIATFWRNLCEGVESVDRFEPHELEDGFDAATRARKEYVPARPILRDVEKFDAGFFGMHAREAALTDPQQRIFLECAWEALEDAGHDPSRRAGAIGVFAGASMNTYFLHHVCKDRETIEDFTNNFQVGNYQMLIGGGDFIATRTAYKLGLHGPAVSMNTACSTSLVAIAQACQSLMLYQSDMALAGGASISFPQKRGYFHQAGGMVSGDGHCRAFDEAASGTVFGSGVGVVLLRRLEDALADGDRIYAVIRGTAVNNDGAGKVGFTAPSIDGQAAVIEAAQAAACVSAQSISYVECHGTGTPLGDPIEIAALTQVFAADTDATGFCGIGSVKTNIGHLDAAAGVAGVIKTALSLYHARLPATLHFHRPNPRLGLEASPFFVNAALTEWPVGVEPRRAGVSALGVGGTNAHAVLEEAPPMLAADDASPAQLLVVSARGEAALHEARGALAEHLATHPEQALADVAFTLQTGRRAFSHRVAVACADRDAAVAGLNDPAVKAVVAKEPAPQVAFMFPGQGAQYPGMGRTLYDNVPVFREAIDTCAAVLDPLLGLDIRTLLYPAHPPADEENPLLTTALAQPAIFAVEYATARTWLSLGVSPAAMIGHSVGEFVAACLAEVMSLDDALAVVATRGELMATLPRGAMLAVRLPEARLAPLLPEGASIAAINGPSLCVASGTFAAIEALEAALAAEGVSARRLHTSHAFHSAMMDPVLAALESRIAAVRLSAPTLPWVSGVTGTWITADEATSPAYWARHCREPVRFADALITLTADAAHAGSAPILLECGPGRALTTLALQGSGRGMVVVPSLADAGRADDDLIRLNEAVGKLWSAGVSPDWSALHAPFNRRRVSLPTYRFQRERCWIDAPAPANSRVSNTSRAMIPTTDPPGGAGSIPAAVTETVIARPDATPAISAAPSEPEAIIMTSNDQQSSNAMRAAKLRERITTILEALSGETLTAADAETSFLELGFDSLMLGQVAQKLQTELGLTVAFRELLGDLPNIAVLADHAAAVLPPDPEAEQPAPVAVPVAAAPIPAAPISAPSMSAAAMPLAMPATPAIHAGVMPAGTGSVMENLMRDQLATMQVLMSQQLDAVRGLGFGVQSGAAPLPTAPAAIAPAQVAPSQAAPIQAAPIQATPAPAAKPAAAVPEAAEAPSRFSAYRPGAQGNANAMEPAQQRHIAALIERYTKRTANSKAQTQRDRGVLADPRAASGFRAEWKEMVYPIICARSKGSRIWDVDGNEYVDLVNGYGQTFFGHAPDFVVDAVTAQLTEGFAIGPQSPLAGEVAALLCELTGNERATFCNTGSEAVMAAMRVARAVTGREKVVVFSGGYHGQFDEVLVKGARGGQARALPIAPGIPRDSVSNMIVLPFATPESLEWIREHAGELAAVIAEPVQSRHPALRPKEFLREVREITAASGTALVFDEVVTGFRMHPGGMQALFDIRADLATYGKVVGGGLPVGILAGKQRFMDALDGGQWRYGDDSYPAVAPTFFAGTFVRHPMTLAACKAVLLRLKNEGTALQDRMAARGADMALRMNTVLAGFGLKSRVEQFGSLLYCGLSGDHRFGGLLYHHMRDRGVHVQDGFPWFLTTEHGDAEIERIVDVFSDSLREMIADNIITPTEPVLINGCVEAPPTEPQTEIWLSAQLGDAASCAFNEGISLRLDGKFDRAALTEALNEVIARHDALRTVFSPTGERLRVMPSLEMDIPVVDLTASGDAGLAALIDEEARTPLDLVEGPLFRVRLARLPAERHVLVFTGHHIVTDGWSINVIVTELAALYAARTGGPAAALGPVMPFSEYATIQSRTANSETEDWWVARFATLPPTLELPTDRHRPRQKSFGGATYRDGIDQPLYAAVKKAGAKQGCTLFVTLLAGFQALLGRLADTTDLVVGIPSAGQSAVPDSVLVGHCVNFLPLRATWQDDTRMPQLMQAVRRTVLEAYEHQNFTFGTLVRRLNPPREPGRLPIVEVQFNLERMADGIAAPGLDITMTPNPKRFTNFDIFLNMIEHDQGLRIDVDYNTDLFDEATIARWIGHFRTILTAIANNPDQEVRRLPLLSAEEQSASRACLTDTAAAWPEQHTVDALVAAQAARTPDRIAVRFGDETLTHQTLQRRVRQLASRLRREVGSADGRVGVLMNRSADMLVALLGTLHAGLAYVPLDPTHPPARLSMILSEAQVSLVLTDAPASPMVEALGVKLLRLDAERASLEQEPEAPAGAVSGDRTAYVIFTSGSTGKPKGVEITHRSVVNLLASMARAPGLRQEDRLLAVTTVAFDIAALELFLPLAVGAELVIADPDAVADGFALLALIRSSAPTAMQATPTLWRILTEAGFKAAPGFKMLCGGEALDRDLANRLLEGGAELWNMYGPTETTIWSATEKVEVGDAPITIGRPIANTGLHVLDRNNEPAPIGVTGELCISGDGLARGYFHRSDLTEAAFQTVSIMGGEPMRIYRTGDNARLLPDFRVQVLGRRDSQVKLRGFRIELGEIEAALTQLPSVAAGAVVLREEDSGKRLVGYVVDRAGATNGPAELMAALGESLPDYMVPTLWVRMPGLPMTANGKIDRRALPAPDPQAMRPVGEPEPPRTEMEATLAGIWRTVLGLERVGINDNLFELGADSIHVFRIAARMMDAGIGLGAKHLIQNPTIASLAVAAAGAAPVNPALSPLEFARKRRERLSV